MSDRLPWMKFYSKDALGDPALRLCTPEARGVWYDMLWLMDVAERRGFLTRNGHPYPDEDLSRILAVTPEELARAKKVLLGAGVPSIEEGTGIWFNRRMVRDEGRRVVGSASGRKGGGNPALKAPPAPPKRKTPPTKERSQKPELRTPIKGAFIGQGNGDVCLPQVLQSVEGFESEWVAFLDNRKAKRAKASPRAQELILATLSEKPHMAVAGLKEAIMRNWTGFKWDWMQGRIGTPTPKPSHPTRDLLTYEGKVFEEGKG